MAASRYGWAHQRLKATWQRRIDRSTDENPVLCRRHPAGKCLEDDPRIYPGDDWRLGHPDVEVPEGLTAPEHVRCNQTTAPRFAGRAAPPPAKHPGLR